MTAISHDIVKYQKRTYDIFSSIRLFNPKKHRMKIGPGTTYNPSGYSCRYKIENDILYLDGLSHSIDPKPSKGLLRFIWPQPRKINGVDATPDDREGWWEVHYDNINLKISFSGTFLIGVRGLETDGLDDDDYKKMVELEFTKGMVTNERTIKTHSLV